MPMKQRSRTYHSLVNSAVGMLTAVLNVALNFLVRVAIVRSLGEEINGLHSLFQNIINIIAVVEASMCTAMLIHLYEPIKHDDVQELSKILGFYRRIYRALAAGFLVVGGVLNLFLGQLITTDIPMPQVHAYFFIFTLSVAVGYLTYTYRLILFAAQKNRISALATLFAEVVFRGGAALTAIVLQNYAVFLLCFIGEKLCGNLICRFCVRRMYPGIRYSSKGAAYGPLRTKVLGTVKPLLVSRVADIAQNSSQSILISLLLGNLAIVGYYGNYALVVGSVGLLYSQLGAAFTSSFGNLATEKEPARMKRAYLRAVTLMSIPTTVICAGFAVCIQDFIALVFGPGFLLSGTAVWILTATMFVTLINIPVVSVQNAMGLHRCDAPMMVLQAVLAVALGYLGGRFFGMEGILLGMLLPLIAFTTVNKGFRVLRLAFGAHWREHTLTVLMLTGKAVLACGVCAAACSFIGSGSFLVNILLKGCTAILLSLIIFHFTSLGNSWYNELIRTVWKRAASLYRKYVRKGAD